MGTAFDVPNALNLFVTSINDGSNVVGGFSKIRPVTLWDKTREHHPLSMLLTHSRRRWGRGRQVTSINNSRNVAGSFQDASTVIKATDLCRIWKMELSPCLCPEVAPFMVKALGLRHQYG